MSEDSAESGGRFTVLFAAATAEFNLAAALLGECLHAAAPRGVGPRLLVRHYGRAFSEVDASFIRDVLLHRPRVLALSCYFWNLDENLRLARLAKRLDPAIVTVLGGPQVGAVRDAVALARREEAVDAVLCGEAELRFADFVLRLARGDAPERVAGAVLRCRGELAVGDDDYEVPDLARLPAVFHDGNAYLTSCAPEDLHTLQTLRGCRNRCTYCLYAVPRIRFFPLERVEEEVAFLCARGVRRVRVADAHFGGTDERARRIFELIERHNRSTVFTFYPDPQHVTERYLRAARDANCHALSLGVESLDPRVAAAVGRPAQPEETARIIPELSRCGQLPQVDLMYGLPGQTADSLAADAARLAQAGVRTFLFSPLMLFPGTALAAEAEARGLTVLPTAQGFAFGPDMGLAGYTAAMLVAEAHGVLAVLGRTVELLRARAVTLGPATVRTPDGRSALIELADALRTGGRAIRDRVPVLCATAITLLEELAASPLPERELVAEVVRLDLLEHAMRRRAAELRREAARDSRPPQILLPEELDEVAWALHPDAWLEVLRLPPEARPDRGATGPIGCVLSCATATIWEVTPEELELLRGFAPPAAATAGAPRDQPRAWLRRWAGRGVLRPTAT